MTSTVSVVMAVYNGERYLSEAIESVLQQSYPELDVILVDDGSEDGTQAVARRYEPRVRVIGVPHRGIAQAQNLGVSMVRGDYLAFLDGDDVWSVDKLERQVAALRANPKLDMVFGHVKHFISPELPPTVRAALQCPEAPQAARLAGTMLIRADTFRRVGCIETKWVLGEFMSWLCRCQELGVESVMLPDVVLHRRLHQANRGLQHQDARQDYVRILKASLDRRRRLR